MSLDHMGVIAARLRKDVTTPTSEQENEELVDILAQVLQSKLDAGGTATPSPTTLTRMVNIRMWESYQILLYIIMWLKWLIVMMYYRMLFQKITNICRKH